MEYMYFQLRTSLLVLNTARRRE